MIAWLAYPLIVGGGMVAGGIAIARGHDGSLVIMVLGTLVMVAIAILERVAPHVPDWNRSRRDIIPDFLHLVVSNALVISAINLTVLQWGSVAAIWPRSWPLGAQLALAFVVGEFGIYWAHRFLHRRALWRFHELHHSAERMYWLNGFRNHPLDAPFQYLFLMVPLVAIGAGPEIISLIGLFQALHTPLQHSNVALRTGWLSYVIATAELHRSHHARELPVASANYGTNLILWDIVFGTFARPAPETTDVGLVGNVAFPDRYLAQLARPFESGPGAP